MGVRACGKCVDLPNIVKKPAKRAALWEKPSSNMIWEY